ncbi:hypothetical protein M8J75_002703 [Diaphorina citri]|nr:hypothetical protein M8J75_002703 [Diaphorina citri]
MDVKLSSSKIFTSSCIELKRDELDEKYEKCHSILQKMLHGLSEQECNDMLNKTICKDKQHEEIVILGLLTNILVDPSNGAKSYRDLSLVCRDGLACAVAALNELLGRWTRLADTSRVQFVYIIGEMIRGGIVGVDSVVWNLLRYAAGGDVSPRNILLVTSLLDIFQDNKVWLEKHPVILSNVVYTYLRLIEDHSSPPLLPLRQRETNFVIGLLREKWSECVSTIGRDLVRLLQNVARIPEFEALWRQMIHQPQTLSPKFTGILQILQTRTSRRFLQSRLTPEMERKLVFLTSNVKFGLQKRYQDWFTKQYLSTTESQALRYDVIRFIVGVIHPTNELLWPGGGGGGGGGGKEAVFSDDEEDNTPTLNNTNSKRVKPSPGGAPINSAPLPPCSDLLSVDMKSHMSTLYGENDSEVKCLAMERIVELILQEDYEQEILSAVGNTLAVVLHSQLSLTAFPEHPTSEYLEDSIGRPLCVLFRSMCQLREDDSRFSMLACVLSELYTAAPCVGYLLLYYLCVSSRETSSYASEPSGNNTNKMSNNNSSNESNNNKSFVYKEFCTYIDKELESCLLTDLTLCQEDDANLLCYLVPYIYNEFPEHVVNNGHILNVVVGTIDARQLQTLISLVIQGRLVMMKGPGIQTLLQVSLTWETFEQMCLWQLFSAHDIALAQILPILPRLKFSFHAEALSAILLLLKQEKPDEDSLKQVLCREVKPLSDMFVVSILQHWCQTDADLLAEILSDLLSTRCPATSPNKRKRGGQGQGLGAKAGVTPPSAERILGHLERVRYGCKVLFLNTRMQRALHIAQACCTDTQRTLYSNLFALLDEGETSSTTNNCSNQNSNSKSNSNKRGRRVNRSSGGGTGGSSNARNSGGSTGRQSRATSASVVDISSESRSDSSSEEELVKVKPAPKKRKKAPAVLHSDSD